MYPFKFVENNSYSKTGTHEPVSGAESRAISHSAQLRLTSHVISYNAIQHIGYHLYAQCCSYKAGIGSSILSKFQQ